MHVRTALQSELAKLGLTEEAKEKYFALLWSAATDLRPQAERDRLNDMRLLGRAFLPSENPSGKKDTPQLLPICDLDVGLEAMGLGDQVIAAHLSAQTDFVIDDDTRAEMDRQD